LIALRRLAVLAHWRLAAAHFSSRFARPVLFTRRLALRRFWPTRSVISALRSRRLAPYSFGRVMGRFMGGLALGLFSVRLCPIAISRLFRACRLFAKGGFTLMGRLAVTFWLAFKLGLTLVFGLPLILRFVAVFGFIPVFRLALVFWLIARLRLVAISRLAAFGLFVARRWIVVPIRRRRFARLASCPRQPPLGTHQPRFDEFR